MLSCNKKNACLYILRWEAYLWPRFLLRRALQAQNVFFFSVDPQFRRQCSRCQTSCWSITSRSHEPSWEMTPTSWRYDPEKPAAIPWYSTVIWISLFFFFPFWGCSVGPSVKLQDRCPPTLLCVCHQWGMSSFLTWFTRFAVLYTEAFNLTCQGGLTAKWINASSHPCRWNRWVTTWSSSTGFSTWWKASSGILTCTWAPTYAA